MPRVDEFAQPILLFQGGVQVDGPHPVERGPHDATLAALLLEEAPEGLSAPRASPTRKKAASSRCKMSMFWAMASTLSGSCKKEPSCPASVTGRSLLLRKSSRSPRLMRQCLPTFRHVRFPSLHHL